MSRLAEIYKQEKQSGAGIGSAVGKRLGERLDPRQIFDRSGVIATMFPALKSYSATKAVKGAATTPNAATPALSLDASAFSDISAASKISAKNSMVLPAMARDMNLMRQNIAKIVKLQGGTAATKGDMFFRRAAERESMFESAFSKMTRKSGSVGFTAGGTKTRDGQTKETALYVETSGILDGLLGGLVGGAAAGGARGKISGALAKALPFLASATLPVLGIAGLAGLLHFLIRKDSGEAQTVDEMKEEGGYTPEQQSRAAPEAKPFTVDEQIKARENMRASEDPTVRAAAAELDKTSPLPITPTSIVTPEPVSGMDHPSAGAAMAPSTPAATTPTTPTKVPSATVPSVSGLPIDYKAYAEKIGEKESGGKYDAVNTLGYLGKYQFGALALQDMGLVKKGTSLKGLDDPANWNIEGGKQAFLKNAQLQEDTMAKYTKQNFATLNRIGVINDKSSQQEIAGYLAASHLLGPGGAKQLAQGNVGSDAYGTTSASYFKVGSATQGLGGAATVASAVPASPSSGAVVASASTTVADGQRTTGGSSNVVVDNSQRTTVASSASAGKPASAYDKDMIDALVGTSYA
jgi:hypothetical protein